MLELRGVSKTFGNFKALDAVDFHVNAGEIVGLLGENGAGKSTLLGLVSGNLAPTNGVLAWQNQSLVLKSPRAATQLGIGIVHQHFRLVPSFTVAENIALAAPSSRCVFSQKEWCARIETWVRELGWQMDATKKVEELGVGQRQRVEILKALFAREHEKGSDSKAKLLLLDEPTANLTPGEVDELFTVLRRLKAQGCGLVFVSHKLNEVLALCDRVTVLRRGKNAGERLIEKTDAEDLAQLMVGRAFSKIADDNPAQPKKNGAPGLEIKNLSCGVLRDFSLSIAHGEIVGIAGVDGNGQAELVEVLSGLKTSSAGSFRVVYSSPDIPHSSIAFIPPDRTHVGLIPAFTLYENMALHPALRNECKRISGFDWKRAKARTRELMEKFDVRAPQTQESAAASELSGGNQQKLLIARALSFPHDVVIAADPARGLDVAATHFVHQQLKNAAHNGAAVLLISSDLDEIIALSDRIGVLYEGQLSPQENLLPRGAAREEIGKLMGGFRHTEKKNP